MLITHLRRGAAITAAVVAFLLLTASPALARTKWADVRVVTHTGRTLAEFRQYTGSTTVRASRKANCFGPDNPSSGKRYKLDGANALGILADASQPDGALRPLLINDSFVDDGFGLGVCSIGGFQTADLSYWYLAVNGAAGQTGPDLIPLHDGDHVLWYLTSGQEPGFPTELALKAPAAADPGKPFTVSVARLAANGSKGPAAGVTVTAAGRTLGRTGSDGKLRVSLPASATLEATGTGSDVPSNRERVCVSGASGGCPTADGKVIYGSSHGDTIDGTRGWDRIKARGGGDVVDLRSGGRDHVSCGGGRDEVIVDRGDRDDDIASSCERVIRR